MRLLLLITLSALGLSDSKTANATSYASCIRQLTGVFYDPSFPNHAVIADAPNAPTQQLGPALIENTKRVYHQLPPGMEVPRRGTVEFTPVESVYEVDSAFHPTLLDKGDPHSGKILWDAPAKLGDQQIYLDIHSHELGHKISMVNLKKSDPELYEEISKAYRSDPTGGSVEDLQNAAVAMETQLRRLIEERRDIEQIQQAKSYLLHLQTERRRAELLKKYNRVSRDQLLSVWSEYDEVFADLVSINTADNPSAMKKSVLAIGGGKSEAAARDFSVDPGHRFDHSSDEHQVLARTRYHVWKKYLQGATQKQKETVLEVFHRAQVKETRRLYENPKLARRNGSERNDDLILAIDQLMNSH